MCTLVHSLREESVGGLFCALRFTKECVCATNPMVRCDIGGAFRTQQRSAEELDVFMSMHTSLPDGIDNDAQSMLHQVDEDSLEDAESAKGNGDEKHLVADALEDNVYANESGTKVSDAGRKGQAAVVSQFTNTRRNNPLPPPSSLSLPPDINRNFRSGSRSRSRRSFRLKNKNRNHVKQSENYEPLLTTATSQPPTSCRKMP